jgi:hypothetical protein
MHYTLRYTAEAPLQPRPHGPTVAKFATYGVCASCDNGINDCTEGYCTHERTTDEHDDD